MNKTKIEWCDSTWNPVTGCLHGCEYCYARRIAERFGTGWEPVKNLYPVLDKPMCGMRSMAKKGRVEPFPYNFRPTFHRYRLEEPQRKKKPQTIFVCSMADLFGDWVPDEWIEEVFDACKKAPQHRYLFLTKNPVRYARLAVAGKLPKVDNMWYGSTLDSMKATRYPGRFGDNTFLSIEPVLERMDVGLGSFGRSRWIIIGAETGNRKEKVVPEKEWIDTICKAADLTQASVFMKDSLLPIMGEENMRREFPWRR